MPAVLGGRFCRSILALTSLMFASLVLLPIAARAEKLRPTPPLQIDILPESPRQHDAWTPPETQLPETLVSTTTALFLEGLADPRGCEYCEVEVGTGNCWSGDSGIIATHGWIFPAPEDKTPEDKTPNDKAHKDNAQRFAVCWNGLVYAAVSVGQPADLAADVAAAIKQGERFGDNAVPEPISVSATELLPLRACLLLRLGEEGLASQAWASVLQRNVNNNGRDRKDPYLLLAADWVWTWFDRAVCAHMRGDDRLALADARRLPKVRDAVETEAKARGLSRPLTGDNRDRSKVPYLLFLEQLDQLLADQERRAGEPHPPENLAVDPDAAPQQRIAQLIEFLQFVHVGQFGQPGNVQLSDGAVVQALIAENGAAVEPLLECLEDDDRLTRSVRFGRDFHRGREILGADQAAYWALERILKTYEFGGVAARGQINYSTRAGRKDAAATIRSYWLRYQKTSQVERWYGILADNQASARQWLEAAHNISKPVSPTSNWHYGSGWLRRVDYKHDATRSLAGESLRSKVDPSVAELIGRRVDELGDRPYRSSKDDFLLRDATRLALDLAKWDRAAARPVLEKQWQRCRDRLATPSAGSVRAEFVSDVGQLTDALCVGEDRAILDQYAKWIRSQTPKSTHDHQIAALRPLWRNADYPAVATAAEWLFQSPESPWNPVLQDRPPGENYRLETLIYSPLLGIPAFREQILKQLENHDRAATVHMRERGFTDLKTTLVSSGGGGFTYAADPLAPPTGTEIEVSVADLHASLLARLDGFPECKLYWPQANRDQAVATCAARLRQFGARFHYAGSESETGLWADHPETRLLFEPLDHPATAEEVTQGLAIFSLAGDGEIRLWKMSQRPLSARWVTLKDYPYDQYYSDSKDRENGVRTEYAQKGFVWQAEEQQQEGDWQRYYGFVGRFVIDRVPAAEIEFPTDDSWGSLTEAIDCKLVPVQTAEAQRDAKLNIGDPLPLILQLRNRRGIPQAVPDSCIRQAHAAGLALHAGLTLRLEYAPPPQSLEDEFGGSLPTDWQQLPSKPTDHFAQSADRHTLDATEESAAGQFDLNDWFTITEPGWYRVSISFSAKDGCFADGESNKLVFSLLKRAE